MTNKEYLQSALGRFGVSGSDLDLILVENDLTAEQEVEVRKCKEAMYRNFTHWLPIHSQISEGGVTEAWNLRAVQSYYGLLCKELNKPNILEDFQRQNEVSDKSHLW